MQSSSCLMLDIEGIELTANDRELILHPATGGLILFARNYESPKQITELCRAIKSVKQEIIIAVDQEGGRVQRFKEGFTRLPSMLSLASLDMPPEEHASLIESLGWLMASELIACGVDISFAPVLDVDTGLSQVIGDRSFGATPESVISKAAHWVKGMHRAGMAATGKHFPGHGSVEADSHIAIPVDNRTEQDILGHEGRVFEQLATAGMIEGIMPAHVIYDQVDEHPACFSDYWLQEILRNKMNFDGLIFSDDLTMHGASVMGDMLTRCHSAVEAGCDMILICNDREAVESVIDRLDVAPSMARTKRIQSMLAAPSQHFNSLAELQESEAWQSVNESIKHLGL